MFDSIPSPRRNPPCPPPPKPTPTPTPKVDTSKYDKAIAYFLKLYEDELSFYEELKQQWMEMGIYDEGGAAVKEAFNQSASVYKLAVEALIEKRDRYLG